MKVSLITILDNTNFGTYLQALALSKTIEKLGLDVEIVDYTVRACHGLAVCRGHATHGRSY